MGEVKQLSEAIEGIWATGTPDLDEDQNAVVDQAMALIDQGRIRCAEPDGDAWSVNQWVKKAIALHYQSARLTQEWEAGPLRFRDRFSVKDNLEAAQIRVVPPAAARYGSFFAPGVTLSASYAHLGVWVGADTLIDTWVALGTCSQIGARVKILPCTSIVGSLYPLEAMPAVVEDDCFIGSGCVIGAGTLLRRGAVVAPGVTLSSTSPVVDVSGTRAVRLGAEVPENAIVVPGTVELSERAPAGVRIGAGLVIGYRDPDVPAKESLAEAGRRFGLPVE